MASIPRPTTKELIFQATAVLLFSVGLGVLLWLRQDIQALKRALTDLQAKRARLMEMEKELTEYAVVKRVFIPCSHYKTPLFWENVEVNLADLRFDEFIAHLDSLGRDVRQAVAGGRASSGIGGVFLLDRLEMKMAKGEGREGGAEAGAQEGVERPVFRIEGRLLSACGMAAGGDRSSWPMNTAAHLGTEGMK